LAKSPITLAMFEEMKKSALFTDEDVRFLRLSHDVVKGQVEAILDVWYGFIGSTPHLVAVFADRHGTPSGEYLAAVRKRFGQWILDTARAQYDQAWLDYQHEIGLRHHSLKKNQTDGVAAVAIVPFRHLFPVVFPVTATLRPFLARHGHSQDEVEGMHVAWRKSCLLQLTLWSYPYIQPGDF
ncbi:MAG TPA: protoglobin domain-containing protein, partial [Polyangiales bacterium]